jgi:hypothetical protein
MRNLTVPTALRQDSYPSFLSISAYRSATLSNLSMNLLEKVRLPALNIRIIHCANLASTGVAPEMLPRYGFVNASLGACRLLMAILAIVG